jgi:3-methyladenine DNA glycosylase AlkD
MHHQVKRELSRLKNPKQAIVLAGFFKTGKGGYGEGDVFWGISVGDQRRLAKKYFELPLVQVQLLLADSVHECRLTALLILILKYQKANEAMRKKIVDFYLKNSKRINNWDLVDVSASKILGHYFLDKNRDFLYRLARSENLWERRMAILTTLAFIRENQFEETLKIAQILLTDEHDLIHKAVGWMLREVGKKDQGIEERFLKKHYQAMPRTMLRYAIERFDRKKRNFYLRK